MSENHDIYRKLQKRLDKLPIGFPPTDSGVEVELLKSLFSPQEAEITIHLKLLPETLGVISNVLKSIRLK